MTCRPTTGAAEQDPTLELFEPSVAAYVKLAAETTPPPPRGLPGHGPSET
jgi:hypothetical protein